MTHRMDLPLGGWLSTILKIVNESEPSPAVARLRRRLAQLVERTFPLRLSARLLPPLSVSVRRNRLALHSYLGPSNEADVEEIEQEGYPEWIAARHANELEGVIYALSADPLGDRVRRCDRCNKFFLARRNHQRKHHFCCSEHRRAFDHAHRDPKKQAAYMRTYRQTLADRARARTRAR